MSQSLSAPVITPAQEEAELAGLSPEELQLWRSDVYGGAQNATLLANETDALREKCLAELHQALHEMHAEDKKEYIEACNSNQNLVERESPPMAFIRHHNYDAHAAARQLVSYWRVRNQLFSSSHALLPMTIDGAMARDVWAMKRIKLMMLPDDRFGRPVWFGNRVRINSATTDSATALRVAFYCFQTLMERDEVPTGGFVAVMNYMEYDFFTHYDRGFAKKTKQMLQGFPCNLCAMHMCTGIGRSVFDVVLPIFKFVLGKKLRMRSIVHSGSEEEVLKSVLPYGLTEAHTKILSGGQLLETKVFEAWLEHRRQQEANIRSSNPQGAANDDMSMGDDMDLS